jgi:hypothetical protein
MLPPVYNTLRASSAVVQIVDDRIWRHNIAPQDGARPYLTWFLVTNLPDNHLSGLPPSDHMTVQVDCWADSDEQAEELAIAVRDAIEPYAHMTGQPIDAREPGTKLWRMALEFDWIMLRTLPEPTS